MCRDVCQRLAHLLGPSNWTTSRFLVVMRKNALDALLDGLNDPAKWETNGFKLNALFDGRDCWRNDQHPDTLGESRRPGAGKHRRGTLSLKAIGLQDRKSTRLNSSHL